MKESGEDVEFVLINEEKKNGKKADTYENSGIVKLVYFKKKKERRARPKRTQSKLSKLSNILILMYINNFKLRKLQLKTELWPLKSKNLISRITVYQTVGNNSNKTSKSQSIARKTTMYYNVSLKLIIFTRSSNDGLAWWRRGCWTRRRVGLQNHKLYYSFILRTYFEMVI